MVQKFLPSSFPLIFRSGFGKVFTGQKKIIIKIFKVIELRARIILIILKENSEQTKDERLVHDL